MAKIKIKNFGPVKEGVVDGDGFFEIKKVTLLIGNQGSGKSTVAKVISTLQWMEKAINRGDFDTAWSFASFENQFKYQNLHEYFNDKTEIDYIGEKYRIWYNEKANQWPIITEVEGDSYIVPKIMYVPSERNFLSVIEGASSVRGLPEPLFEFASELKTVQNEMGQSSIELPINKVSYKYDRATGQGQIYDSAFKISILSASSGFQSLVPMFLVSKNLAERIQKGLDVNAENFDVNRKLRMNKQIADVMISSESSDNEKLNEVENIKNKYISKCFINIVEEPEQNLFPSSQLQMLFSLLEFNNKSDGNKLIITTHSPYLINYLTLCVKASMVVDTLLSKKIEFDSPEMSHLNSIVPIASTVKPADVVVYQLDETKGIINKLNDYKGLPSDENYLNYSLENANEFFAQLQEIENECQ